MLLAQHMLAHVVPELTTVMYVLHALTHLWSLHVLGAVQNPEY
jgi:hypothetical protein